MAPVSVQIVCINKRQHQNPHERIAHVGGVNADGTRWKMTESDAIDAIEQGRFRFYVSVGGKSVWVVVAVHLGRKYLKTEADSYAPNNLLSLPECP
jgi:hypothetical protein